MSAPPFHVERFRVRSDELDVAGRVGLGPLCRYLQEAAGRHAVALDVAMERLAPLGLTWMLARLILRLSDFRPAWRDELAVETWPSGREGIRALRDFLIKDGEGRTLGRATSTWLVVDRERRRAARLPAAVTELKLPERERALIDPGQTPEAPEPASFKTRALRVRRSDLDLNAHLNNARAAELLLEPLDEELLAEGSLAAATIVFKGEAALGAELEARAALEARRGTLLPGESLGSGGEGLRVAHALEALEGTKRRELIRAESVWRRPG